MGIKKHRLLTKGQPFQWKVDLRGGGVNEAVAVTTAEKRGGVVLEFYRTVGADDPTLSALDIDDDRQPASIFRWAMGYEDFQQFNESLRGPVRELVYDKRRTKVQFRLAPGVEVVLTLDRTDIDQLIRVTNEALTVSKPDNALAIAS